MICAKNINFEVKTRRILNNINIDFKKPELVVILGPNGAGKSTLLQILAGFIKEAQGEVTYKGKNINDWKLDELAKTRSFLQQQNAIFGSFAVEDILEMGRYPHFKSAPTQMDRKLIDLALEEINFAHQRKRVYQTLSGGEQQRVQFARAVLQLQDSDREDYSNKVLFLDEPLNNLDLQYQYSLMELSRQKVVDNGGIVIAVLHDLNIAYQFADRIIILKDGNLVVDENKEHAYDTEILSQIFQVNIKKVEYAPGKCFFETSSAQYSDSKKENIYHHNSI